MRYGVVGEHDSDACSVRAIIKGIVKAYSLPAPIIHVKGYEGWGKMFVKAPGQLRAFVELDCERIVVCFDADGPDPEPRRKRVIQEIISKSGVTADCWAAIPIRTIEAWILADIE